MREESLQPGEVEIAATATDAARATVSAWRREIEDEIAPFREHQWSGSLEGPALHLDDVSDIPFLVDIQGVEQYQHRARLRARSGDFLAAVTELPPGYEDYCRDRLGMGSPSQLTPQLAGNALQVAEACRLDESTFETLTAAARTSGRLLVHPYMAIKSVWSLAAEIARQAGARVEVVGPPPPVTWIANDKARFDDLVERVLGADWLVDSRRSNDPTELSRALLELAQLHRRVGLKRLRCASAMGNLVLDSTELPSADAAELVVRGFLDRTQWQGDEEVLVVAWEETRLSPSTQLWIPPRGQSLPTLDGVYDQILEGEQGVFVGSRPSSLPLVVQRRLGRAALAVGTALQELGYAGRCSFDHLVLGDVAHDPESCELRFTECNGRWGGTSLPMSFMDRLGVGGQPGRRPPYRAQDFVDERLVGVSFPELLRLIGDAAYDATTGRGRFLFYNVGPLVASGKFDVIAWGSSQSDAERALEHELPGLLGLK